jgi:hypothetical protein
VKRISLPSILLLALAGCAASGDNSDSGQDDITSRPPIDLRGDDGTSVQGNLFKLLQAFQADAQFNVLGLADGPALTLTGAKEPHVPNRAITCTTATVVTSTLSVGTSLIPSFSCMFEGFDRIRNGGQLPQVVSPRAGDQPLASKLMSLLAAGEKRGGFGIVDTSPTGAPTCCDIPHTKTFSMSSKGASLVCSSHTGGLGAITTVDCTYVASDATPNDGSKPSK